MLTNTRQRANGHFLQVLYTKTFLLPGINLNATKPKQVFVKKQIKMNYLRSTCRRQSAATQSETLAGQWKPQFAIDETGAQFNNVYVRAMATCVTKNAKVNVLQGANNTSLGTASKAYTIPAVYNMADGAGPWPYTDVKNARFQYSGTIGVKHYCQEISRGFGNSEMTALGNLQNQINQIQDAIAPHLSDSDCTSCDEESVHSDSDSDCGSGHQAGASPPGDGHTHPNNLTAEEHDANCQHSH
jgi:hypothetical protein